MTRSSIYDFDPRDKISSIARINACIKDIKMWLCANRLCINESKTEALLISKKETVATSIQNGGSNYDSLIVRTVAFPVQVAYWI